MARLTRPTSVSSRVRGYLPEIAIATAAILYGSTFTIVQDALDDLTPSGLNVYRFALGAAVLAPFALTRSWRGPAPRPSDSNRTLVWGGVAIGAIATGAYFCQNLGLQHTSTSNSAFITGLFAVTTPIIESIVFRRAPRRAIWVAVAMSVFGLFLLTGAEPSLGFGDSVTLVTAVLFGFWFVLIGVFTNRLDSICLTAVQLVVIAALSLPIALIEGFGALSSDAWIAILFTGIGCSAIAFSLSVWAQRTIEPSRASLLNLLEPVVAGIIGYAVGERLLVVGYLGAALILAAIVVAERGTHRRTAAGV
ncbi:MAG: DMT family transporter [Acidimicrobiia bacterium]